MGDPDSMISILWSTDPTTLRAIWLVLIAVTLAVVFVYAPLAVRAVRLFLLERSLREQVSDDGHGRRGGADPVRDAMLDSPLAEAFEEFERRWSSSQLGEQRDRAPIRLIDVFDDRPLLPLGPRRSLLPVLPGLFLGIGVFAALTGLIPSLSGLDADEAPAASQSAWMAMQMGLALRATAWGFLSAIGASLAGRLLEGAFNARSYGLDEVVEQAYGSVSPGELAELTRQTQQRSLDTLGKELTQFANELNERLDRGLQRIEQSTARSASLVSQEQRGALHTVVQELSLSVRQGVENHLAELRGALQRAIEHQGAVTGGLAETFERMVENAQTQDRVARTLVESASSVEEAARSMRGSATEMQPVLDNLSSTSRALSETAGRMGDTQTIVARAAEGVRGSLEYAASGVDDQRQFIERSLGEIRRALVGLGDGLGDSLQRSLREVDDVLGSTVGQLRDTLAESNETIERLSGPIRSAEGSTREIHVALDRVRNEVEALGQWMNQAIKPLRSGLGDVGTRAEDITRAISEFSNHTRQIDKTMEALRDEIHEESRRLQGAGSDLGRRLTQATDAVGLLESTTSDAARRSRSEPIGPRERSWSPAPASPATTADSTNDGATASTPSQPSKSRFDRPPRSEDEKRPTHAPANETGKVDPADAPDVAGTGFRIGTPRAQGPDPYARFDKGDHGGNAGRTGQEAGTGDDDATPSNVHRLPTRDRDSGDNLKLSGLLGPSGDRDAEASDAAGDDAAPTPKKTEDSE